MTSVPRPIVAPNAGAPRQCTVHNDAVNGGKMVKSITRFSIDLERKVAVSVQALEAAAFYVCQSGDDAQVHTLGHIRSGGKEDLKDAAHAILKKVVLSCTKSMQDRAVLVVETHEGAPIKFCLVNFIAASGVTYAASALVARCTDQAAADEQLRQVRLKLDEELR